MNKNYKCDNRNYSLNELEDIADKISFSPSLSNNVVKRFEVVKKLIIYSCCEYEFLDVAFERALSTFELALRERYYEIEKKDSRNLNLYKLIEWGDNKEIFEESKDRIHSLRKLRNSLVGHVTRYSLFGTMSLGTIISIVATINGLYENVDLRRLRKQKIQKINDKLNNILENGAIFHSKDTKKIIFNGELLSFDSKNDSYKYHFAFYTIFSPIKTKNQIISPESIYVYSNSYDFKNDVLSINDVDSAEIKITKIIKKENQNKYDNWRKHFYSNKSLKDMTYMIIKYNNYKQKLNKIIYNI